MAALALEAWGVPAEPGVKRLVEADGSVIEATIIGDEHFHYYETAGGELLIRDASGKLSRAGVDAAGKLVALGMPTGKATPTAEAEAIRRAAASARFTKLDNAMKRKVAPGKITTTFPTTGTVKGLIIMAEFEDIKFTEQSTRDFYDKKINTPGYSDSSTCGSVYDYFTTQSSGKFTPRFDVVGPITLPHPRKWYGETERLDDLFRDACKVADAQGVDFTQYDVNKDNFVDFVFVIYAGYGEAQGGPAESIWPAMKDLSDAVYDYFDMMNLSVAACSCELKGNEGTNLDGVGTICHEFSHILGLADIYDSSKQNGYGMAHYDMMDVGTYNGDHVTPSGYTAMDRYTLGWLEPKTFDAAEQEVTLPSIEKSNEAYFIVNPENPNEYFTLENRQKDVWDKGIPHSGLVVSYCHYDADHWKRNTVNAPIVSGYEHVRIVAADNTWSTAGNNEEGDPFPGLKQVTEFGPSHTAYLWQSTKKAPTFTLTDIRENSDGTVTFKFKDPTAGMKGIGTDGETVKVSGRDIEAPAGSEVYDLSGRCVSPQGRTAGVYLVRTPAGKSVKVLVK